MKKMAYAFSTAVLMLAACGEESSNQVLAVDSSSSISGLPVESSSGTADNSVFTVAKICDMPLCEERNNGAKYFVASTQMSYLCQSGVMLDASGVMMNTSDYLNCHLTTVLQGVVESEAALPVCSFDGALYSVNGNIYTCDQLQSVRLGGAVLKASELPACNALAEGVYGYAINAGVLKCAGGMWNSIGGGLSSSSVIPSCSSTIVSSSSFIPSSSSVIPPSSSSIVSSSSKPVSSSSSTVLVSGECGPELTSVLKGGSVRWSYKGSVTPTNYMWVFTNANTTISSAASPLMTYEKVGNATATLIVDSGLPTEQSISCKTMTVKSPDISGCSCTGTTLNNDLALGPVEYTWTVSGCSSTGSEPLTYSWTGYSAGTSTSTVTQYTKKGEYSASVTVTNSDGNKKVVSCGGVKVTDSDNPYIEVENIMPFSDDAVLQAGDYIIKSCNGRTGSLILQVRANYKDCYDSFENLTEVSYWNSSSECTGTAYVQFPAVLHVPAGGAVTFCGGCW